MPQSIRIRNIEPSDAEAAAALTTELGYPTTPEIMQERIRTLACQSDCVVFVGCIEDKVVGWIDVRLVHYLQAEPRGAQVESCATNKSR